MNSVRSSLLALLFTITGCAQNSTFAPSFPSAGRTSPGVVHTPAAASKIRHIVIIVQENRSVNNLFNGLPGAGTVKVGKNSQGQSVTLQPHLLNAPYDLSHKHIAFLTEYNKGQMNGFDLVASSCKKAAKCPPKGQRAYSYVPETDVKPYFTMAERYTFARNMFQTNQGPSFPAHLYLLSGTSAISDTSALRAAENPLAPQGDHTGGCDSPQGTLGALIDQNGNENQTAYPCFDRDSLIGLIEGKSLTWHYYQVTPGSGIWHGPDALKPVWSSPQFSRNVVWPPAQILNDISAGKLANVVWVTPTLQASDHPVLTDGSGPSWVASVVNKIGQSAYWKDTAIFVIWDDWGGWYDPAPPPQYNSYELGMRVPMIVISPYAKPHYISTARHEFGSILKFTETALGLPSMHTTDVRSDDLKDCFDFTQPARKFVLISAPLHADYFLRQTASSGSPDTDF
jgi:phospholipase C